MTWKLIIAGLIHFVLYVNSIKTSKKRKFNIITKQNINVV
jgi:hypothetical protein